MASGPCTVNGVGNRVVGYQLGGWARVMPSPVKTMDLFLLRGFPTSPRSCKRLVISKSALPMAAREFESPLDDGGGDQHVNRYGDPDLSLDGAFRRLELTRVAVKQTINSNLDPGAAGQIL